MVYQLPEDAADDRWLGKLLTVVEVEEKWSHGEKDQHSSRSLIEGASFSESITRRPYI